MYFYLFFSSWATLALEAADSVRLRRHESHHRWT